MQRIDRRDERREWDVASLQRVRLLIIISKKHYSEREKMVRKDFLKYVYGNSFNAERLKSHHSLICWRKIVQNNLLIKYMHKRKTCTINSISIWKEILHKRKNHHVNQLNKYEKKTCFVMCRWRQFVVAYFSLEERKNIHTTFQANILVVKCL
jgi:hypothetical protein